MPNPEDWYTPTFGYANTNMLAQLPKRIPPDGQQGCMLTIDVSDDLKKEVDKIESVDLQILLSDGASSVKNPECRIGSVEIATIGHKGILYNNPPRKGIEKMIGVRINNIELDTPYMQNGWLVFGVEPMNLAVGENLIGVCFRDSKSKKSLELDIEKLEINVTYKN